MRRLPVRGLLTALALAGAQAASIGGMIGAATLVDHTTGKVQAAAHVGQERVGREGEAGREAREGDCPAADPLRLILF